MEGRDDPQVRNNRPRACGRRSCNGADQLLQQLAATARLYGHRPQPSANLRRPERRWRLRDADAGSVADLRYPEQRWRIYHAKTGAAARIYQAAAVTALFTN